MKKVIIIKNIVIVVVILTVVFLSQQPYLKPIGKNLSSYWKNSNNWLGKNAYSKISRGVAGVQDTTKTMISEQKDNIAQIVWEKVKNYFAEKFSKVFGTKVE